MLSPTSDDGTATAVKVQRAAHRGQRPKASELIRWDLNRLEAGKDPLGQGLAPLFKKAVTSALFLAVSPPPAGSPVPHFHSAAVVQAGDKLVLWAGLKWDPTVVPELWNYFIQNGHVELAPPGTTTSITSNRNIVRGAFGVARDEWLTLVRVGTVDCCRGVVALISRQSIVGTMKSELALIQTEYLADWTQAA